MGTSRLYCYVLVSEVMPWEVIYEGFRHSMSLWLLFADVGAFKWDIRQLDWCKFRYTFSHDDVRAHFMLFCQFFTKVPLIEISGVWWKYVVDMSSPVSLDSPPRFALRVKNSLGHLTLASRRFTVGRFGVWSAPVLFNEQSGECVSCYSEKYSYHYLMC